MGQKTDGNYTWVVVDTPLPGPNKQHQEWLNAAAENPPELWFTPVTSTGLNIKLVAMAGLLALGLILIIRGR